MVIALGMALLGQGALTVDVDAGRADFARGGLVEELELERF